MKCSSMSYPLNIKITSEHLDTHNRATKYTLPHTPSHARRLGEAAVGWGLAWPTRPNKTP